MHLVLGYTQMKFYLVLHLNDNFGHSQKKKNNDNF